MWRNTEADYGWVHKILHWAVALTVFALFGLGLWMTGLDYYHAWYREGPDLHRSMGMVLMLVMGVRLLWVLWQGKPKALPGHRRWEVILAGVVHVIFYVLVFTMGVSGYLISTADDRPVGVFDLVFIPSMGELVANQEDIAGEIHEGLAFTLIGLVVVHALAAVKHHFVDKDRTLKRMI